MMSASDKGGRPDGRDACGRRCIIRPSSLIAAMAIAPHTSRRPRVRCIDLCLLGPRTHAAYVRTSGETKGRTKQAPWPCTCAVGVDRCRRAWKMLQERAVGRHDEGSDQAHQYYVRHIRNQKGPTAQRHITLIVIYAETMVIICL
jgi:hypothetical protein